MLGTVVKRTFSLPYAVQGLYFLAINVGVKYTTLIATLAQSAEHQTFNLRAAGSSPAGGRYPHFLQWSGLFRIIVGAVPTLVEMAFLLLECAAC